MGLVKEYTNVVGRQSYVSKTGRAWELLVMTEVNYYFKRTKSKLAVVDGKRQKGTKLWDNLAISVGNKGKVEGDIDLIVINKNKPNIPRAVISCKTSLHGRFSETLFYALVWKKAIPKFIVVFATPDKGRQGHKGIWQSEWGTVQKPTKDRQLGEMFLDGVYVGNKRTSFGGKIKPITDLPKDLERLIN
jgi:hypothetical protein